MKKFLVLCVSAAMLLSTAAMSLAAATVGGDFRYDMYQDESKTDESYAETALYYSVAGDVSDSVYAFAKFKVSQKSGTTDDSWDSVVDEFYATAKYFWGTAKMGYYEYKFTPSRVELKSAGMHVFPKTDATFEVNVPVAEGFTVDGVVAPYNHKNSDGDVQVDDGAYAVAVNYKTENWGAKVTYADFAEDTLGDLTALDVYYQINDDMKAFVDAVDYSEYEGNTGDKYQDGFDPVLGFVWSNIGGTNLKASAEYAINKRFDDTSKEYSEYVLKAEYKLTNNVNLVLYHFVVGDSKTKDKFRIQYKF
jgi:hypothetical protein